MPRRGAASFRIALAATGLLAGVLALVALPLAQDASMAWGLAFMAVAFVASGLLFAAAARPAPVRVLLATFALLALGLAGLGFYLFGGAPILLLAAGLAAAGAAVGPLLAALRMRARR